MNHKTTATGDAAEVIALLAWAQEAGLELAQVTVGACHVELHRTGGKPEDDRAEPADDRGIYARFGGAALAHAVSEIPAGELQPVVKSRGGW